MVLLPWVLGCTAEPRGGSELACERTAETRELLRSFCDYFMARDLGSTGIFVAGYATRALVAGHETFGEEPYLSAAVGWADWLLDAQLPSGYWTTGYSKHLYLADTGSALGLVFLLHPRVDAGRRARYESAVRRHVEAIERDGLVLPSGAIGAGWRHESEQDTLLLYADDYTIASSLCGAQVFTWMYVHTHDARYLEIAWNALAWILSTVREDGVVPYVLAGEGADLLEENDAENERTLWDRWRYNTAAYVGEGVIAFHTHCDRPQWRRRVEEEVRPIIEMIVRTQNRDGSWGVPGSDDQKRSPGVVNFLAWYHREVEARDDVREAVCRFAALVGDRAAAREIGLLNAGAPVDHLNAVITSLAARAVGSIVVPGVDVSWERGP